MVRGLPAQPPFFYICEVILRVHYFCTEIQPGPQFSPKVSLFGSKIFEGNKGRPLFVVREFFEVGLLKILVDRHNLPQFDKQSFPKKEIPGLLGLVPFFEVSKDNDFFFDFLLPLQNFFQLEPFQKNFFQRCLRVIIADP